MAAMSLAVDAYQTQEGAETFDSDPDYFFEVVWRAHASGKEIDVDTIFEEFGDDA